METDVDLIHLHTLWTHESVIVQKWAQLWRRPYVVTANGMLEPWAIQNSRWKKKLALAFYERNCLEGAACIQVNSIAEYNSVRQLGFRNAVCIIPNGIDLPEDVPQTFEETKEPPWRKEIPTEHKVLLYLGRLHPKKGLLNLLRAWEQVGKQSGSSGKWTLAIAGWDQGGHEDDLRKLTDRLRLRNSVSFLGPQFGIAKASCYKNCDAFVLPSFSEGLPMVVLEAWAHAKPVLMTDGCNLPDGFSAAAAIRIEPSVDSLIFGLKKLFEMSDDQRTNMGKQGFKLVKRQFNWATIAVQMREVYAWVLDVGPLPPCVSR